MKKLSVLPTLILVAALAPVLATECRAAEIVVPDGTEVTLRLVEPVNSATARSKTSLGSRPPETFWSTAPR